MNSAGSNIDPDVSKTATVREAWVAAVKGGDANRLADMVTDDVAVVHGNGRWVCGKEKFKADLSDGFGRFANEQGVLSTDVIVRKKWAFEIGEVGSTLTPVHEGGEFKLTQGRRRARATG